MVETRPLLASIAGLVPPVSPAQLLRGIRNGVLLRWIAIGLIAATVDTLKRRPSGMALLLAVVILYNAATMLVAFRIPVRWAPRVAFVITVCDGLISFSYLGVYSSQVGTEALGGYSMVILEGIGYFGTLGAVLAVGVFLGAALGVQAADVPLFRHIFDENGILGGMLLMVLPTVCVLVVMHIRIGLASAGSAPAAVQPAPPEPAVRLSRREREVLGLVAAGYSNTMIATRLGLSDTTVKSYVENLLLQLDAHNRAEAVAAASRLNLL